jgi:dephospho-CoA kinase
VVERTGERQFLRRRRQDTMQVDDDSNEVQMPSRQGSTGVSPVGAEDREPNWGRRNRGSTWARRPCHLAGATFAPRREKCQNPLPVGSPHDQGGTGVSPVGAEDRDSYWDSRTRSSTWARRPCHLAGATFAPRREKCQNPLPIGSPHDQGGTGVSPVGAEDRDSYWDSRTRSSTWARRPCYFGGAARRSCQLARWYLPMILGLTGSLGSGKSTVSSHLRDLGAQIICADEIAREVVAKGSPALLDITREFGPDMLDPDGTLDRRAMARLVFADADARRKLEQIIHPRVRERELQLLATFRDSPLIVLDIPLLYETGAEDICDQVMSMGDLVQDGENAQHRRGRRACASRS